MNKKLSKLIPSLLELLLPEGTNKEITLGNTKVKVVKKDGNFELEIKDNEFDDSQIKEKINRFKKALDEVDNDLFTEILEYLESQLDLNYIGRLLDVNKFCEESAKHTSDCIDNFSSKFIDCINNKIHWLSNQRDLFTFLLV